jgi:hypothetical protein
MVELYGKSVVIVGGGELKERIDSFDVVVHINNHVLKYPGVRCNIIYHCGSGRCPIEEVADIPDCEYFVPDWSTGWKDIQGVGRLVHPIMRDGLYSEIVPKDITTPLTGVYAAYDLCREDISELYLTAQDLYRSLPEDNWTPQVRSHNPKLQAKALRALAERDMRVSFCPELEEAIEYYLKEEK